MSCEATSEYSSEKERKELYNTLPKESLIKLLIAAENKLHDMHKKNLIS